MMQFQKGIKPRSGLDNGDQPSKKVKRAAKLEPSKGDTKGDEDAQATESLPALPKSNLKIQPGERMTDFSARVNQALPVSGLTHKGKKIDGMAERTTKLQRKITRRQDAWRRAEAQRQEKEEEAKDAREEASEDEIDYWGESLGTEKKSKRRRRMEGPGRGTVEDDPWAKLKELRERPKGLHDVAKEPPRFGKAPTEKFKNRDGTVTGQEQGPSMAGSLMKRPKPR